MAILQAVLRHRVATDGDLTYQIDASSSVRLADDVIPRIIADMCRLAETVGGTEGLSDLNVWQLQRQFPLPTIDQPGLTASDEE